MAFIDLRKAFDSVNRNMMWHVLRKLGCPRKFVEVVRFFHDNMTASVATRGQETDHFRVEVGVKQGCVLAPVILNLHLAAATILYRQRAGRGVGVGLSYRSDGSVFNLCRLQARTRVNYEEVNELQYADDCALIVEDPESLQQSLNCLAEVYTDMGLAINSDKTEVILQLTGLVAPAGPQVITINGDELKNVPHFKYLGSILSTDWSVDD